MYKVKELKLPCLKPPGRLYQSQDSDLHLFEPRSESFSPNSLHNALWAFPDYTLRLLEEEQWVFTLVPLGVAGKKILTQTKWEKKNYQNWISLKREELDWTCFHKAINELMFQLNSCAGFNMLALFAPLQWAPFFLLPSPLVLWNSPPA